MREIKWILFFLFISSYSYSQIEADTLELQAKEDAGVASVAVISLGDLDGDEESADISGILQSSRDVFVSTAGYTFGAARFRIRGYDSDNSTVMMNGVSLNDMESGRVYWSSWGGLNDALRNSEILNGITASQFAYGGVGGANNMEVRASSYAPSTKFTFSHLNKSYNQRAMLTYATGLKENGWAFTFSGSKRWAQTGYVEGTSYDAYAY
ncbi:MAG: TonB-dependent receptor plug domain-containing protein, partial [Bacteroidales bacterium]|nr:TonB-dependent receptor plug domain-containing protein [Bacteroidales bacterium]